MYYRMLLIMVCAAVMGLQIIAPAQEASVNSKMPNPYTAGHEVMENSYIDVPEEDRVTSPSYSALSDGFFTTQVNVDEFGNNYKQRQLDDGTEFVILKNYFSENELRDLFSPHFKIESLIHNRYYWSVLLRLKS